MPRLQKQTISRYFSSGCDRQLFLNLQVESDLDNQTYPARRVRPALQRLTDLGNEWEAAKVQDLVKTFGLTRLLGVPISLPAGSASGAAGTVLPSGGSRPPQPSTSPGSAPQSVQFADTTLPATLKNAAADTFLVQAEYEVPAQFRDVWGLTPYTGAPTNLSFSAVRPDLIWVRPPGTYPRYVTPDGRLVDLPAGDSRLQFQIVDIKLTAEPSRRHFVEIAYYILVLAAWLEEMGWDRPATPGVTREGYPAGFVVVPEGAVWPGSYEKSPLMLLAELSAPAQAQRSVAEFNVALLAELELIPFEPVAQRLATFFTRDLVRVLTTADWRTLSWQITQKSCSTCDFLGIDLAPGRPMTRRGQQELPHPNYCHVEAQTSQGITQVPFLGRGSKAELERNAIQTTPQLRDLPRDSLIFLDHNQLRADRTLLGRRAEALEEVVTIVPPGRQTIVLPDPRDCDLKIFLTLDFDPASGLTYAFGFHSLWWPPRRSEASTEPSDPASDEAPDDPPPDGPAAQQPQKKLQVLIVQNRSPNAELDQLVTLLTLITSTLREVVAALPPTPAGTPRVPRVQFYLWDTIQVDQARRVMGRHMNAPAIQAQFQQLLWRFPPDTILRSAELEKGSPFAVVKTAIRQLVALPVRYDYSLLATAREYYPPGVNPRRFDVPTLFESGLGDQIPFERAHEMWSGDGYGSPERGNYIPWNMLVGMMQNTVRAKLLALESVVSRLEADLARQKRLLLKPCRVGVGGRPRRPRGMSVDGQLWLNYAQLETVSRRLEVEAIRAMEVEEREARYHTAVLTRRLQGDAARQALAQLGLPPTSGAWVYEMCPTSAEVKLGAEDFTWALAPADIPGFLDRKVVQLANRDEQLAGEWVDRPDKIWWRLERFTNVTVQEIGRDSLLLAVIPGNPQFLETIERLGLVDFSRNVVLDKVYRDFWTDRLERCLQAIGNPPLAQAAPESRTALRQ